MTYDIEISLDLGEVLQPVGELVNKINDGLAEFGCDEKVSVRSKCVSMTLEVKRELSESEKEQMKSIIISQFAESHPAWKARVESFRRQSGNVLQSAVL